MTTEDLFSRLSYLNPTRPYQISAESGLDMESVCILMQKLVRAGRAVPFAQGYVKLASASAFGACAAGGDEDERGSGRVGGAA